MIRELLPRAWKVIAIAAVIVMIPVAVLAAVGSFSSTSSSIPAVKGLNSSASLGAKGVYGVATANASTARFGVEGVASGSGGYGVYGAGAKYGVYSAGPLGVASGKPLTCSGCVSTADLAGPPRFGTHSNNDTATALTTCVAQDSVTIVAPHAGTILVMADFGVRTSHTNGTEDEADFRVNTTSGDCSPDFTAYDAFSVTPGSLPTDTYFDRLQITIPFNVSAGSHTFYLNGAHELGGTQTHWRDSMNAIFISS
jgi:hypothetical protein